MRLLPLILLTARLLVAALPSTTLNWDVRTTGSDNNGGCFDTALGVTDFSAQNTAQVTFSAGNSNQLSAAQNSTTVTSAGTPFTAAMVGNCIQITSGTNFVAGFYEVTAFTSTSQVTFDRAPATAGAGSAGNGALGGGLQTLTTLNNNTVQGNVVNIKAGTYTLTAGLTVNKQGLWIGYNATHNDNGTKPLITTATNSVSILISPSTALVSPAQFQFQNLSFSNTASVRGSGMEGSNSALNMVQIRDCIFDGFVSGVNNTNNSVAVYTLTNVEIKNSTTYGVQINGGTFVCYSCYIHNSTNDAVTFQANNLQAAFFNSILSANANGITTSNNASYHVQLFNSVVANNTTDGINATITGSSVAATNTVFYGNGRYAINFPNGVQSGASVVNGRNNAYGGQGTANFNNVAGSTGDITLTANPFNSSTDFTLNNTAGGGPLLKGTGYPGTAIGSAFLSVQNVGAAQISPTGSFTGGFIASLFRK